MMNVSGLDILGFSGKVGRWLFKILLKPVKAFGAWNRRQRGKRELLSMSDHMLKDLGISRVDAIQYAKGRVQKDVDDQ